MATDNRNLPAYFNSNADFQAWVTGIHAQLLASGLVNTTDTGQINPATVAAPVGANVSQGYEIWKSNDGLTTWYMKIEYGSGSGSSMPGFWVTIGQGGTNGAGTLSAPLSTRWQVMASNSKSAGVTLPSYCQGDGSGFALATNYDGANQGFGIFIMVDRTCDGAGVLKDDGVTMLLWGNGASATNFFLGCQMIAGGSVGTGVTAAQSTGVAAGFFASVTGAFGTAGCGVRVRGANTGLMPAMVQCGQLRFLRRFVAYSPTDIAGSGPANSFSATNLGAAHTYIPLGINLGYNANFNVTGSILTSTSDRIAMLWE